ncbi:MAG: hypothetical protein [Siphoviridae sp. ct7UA22]|nr:MAG: hypothetical protein [Siphoviridae sp. ct7UA22]
MSISKSEALDFFADLLGTPKSKKETLFDTPVAKPKRMARRWSVTSVAVVYQVAICRCCKTRIRHVNPHLMLTKSLNDYDGKITKTIQTDLPDESDMALITPDTPVTYSEIETGTATVCENCITLRDTSLALRTLFAEQVTRLRADPERMKAIRAKQDEAENQLMAMIEGFTYDAPQTVNTPDSDLPY